MARPWLWLLALGVLAVGCRKPVEPVAAREYRDDMARMIIAMSDHARRSHAGFAFVLQNGHEILFRDVEGVAEPRAALVAAVDGAARESLFYGLPRMDAATPAGVQETMRDLLLRASDLGLTAMTIDYCGQADHVDDTYRRAAAFGFLPFAAHRRELDAIPPRPAAPFRVHDGAVRHLGEARNFLYLINPAEYADGDALVAALAPTRYDLFVVDAFANEEPLTRSQVAALQRKPSGQRRLVLSYLSIGEAEVYRDYFDPEWLVDPPPWLAAENPDWAGNYKVRYWDPGWQAILFGHEDAYLDRIVAAGFDGAYLDIVDAFWYFEEGGD